MANNKSVIGIGIGGRMVTMSGGGVPISVPTTTPAPDPAPSTGVDESVIETLEKKTVTDTFTEGEAIKSNVLYNITPSAAGETYNVTIEAPEDGEYSEFMLEVDCTTYVPTVNFPGSVKWNIAPVLEVGNIYQISITFNGSRYLGIWASWASA